MAITKEELEVVYRNLELSLYNFALRWVFDPVVAEEIVHEAFIRVWKIRDKVVLETIKSLLYKTTQNLALNELRRKKLREALPVLNWFDNRENLKTNMESSLIEQEDFLIMKNSLDKMPFKYREVLLMSEYSDMSYAEIAKSLGVAEDTVASRKNRAMEYLRSDFKDGVEYVR